MQNLLERIDTEGPSRELDAAIARSIGFGLVQGEWHNEQYEWYAWYSEQRMGPWIVLPKYTSSIEDALTLVEEGSTTTWAMQDRHSLRWRWEIRTITANKYSAWGDSAALAICKAALKARGYND